ncbi:hypothetical protein DACRYDRAFT_110826 [Dacryopinax primogenitus]|uniref:MARVEL domain-containing protein n=1 Tax=Dacryopinax primogenitus (strain DJM 731) TaxID=1858805 RepID=M5FSW0_DACPD|nr:uncharacterized protein DACRYDRAFT_110826 [Dacryopinax primogenitus]EJT98384.1 hypothetical protein DACRYDRAFT_110826 [Dacryopinax primogenitus]
MPRAGYNILPTTEPAQDVTPLQTVSPPQMSQSNNEWTGHTMTMTISLPHIARVRFWTFWTLLVFSMSMLPIAASLVQSQIPGAQDFGVGIASSLITTLIPVLVLARESKHKDAWTSWTAIELTWMFVCAICWSVTGGRSISNAMWTCNGMCFRWSYQGMGRCTNFSYTICREYRVLAVFSWMIFFMLSTLFIWEFAIAISAHKKGDRFIWKSPAHAYGKGGAIYLEAPSPAFGHSEATLTKGKKADEEAVAERPRTPSALDSI